MNTVINQVMLNKLNVHRNMLKAVIYSPLKWGGLNYPSFQVIQDQKGLLWLLQRLRWNGTIKNDMLVVLQGVQLMSGLITPVFENTTSNLEYLPQGWFLHQRRCLCAINATMWIKHQWSPELQREGDKLLMEEFWNIKGIITGKPKKANWCRIFTLVITVSDFTMVWGESIPGHQMWGKWRAESTFDWPNIKCSHWITTRKYLVVPSKNLNEEGSSRIHIWPVNATVFTPSTKPNRTFMYSTIPTSQIIKSYQMVYCSQKTEHLSISHNQLILRQPLMIDDDDHWWTLHPHNASEDQPAAQVAHVITYRKSTTLNKHGGGDGSVYRSTGNRACAFIVHFEGTEYSGAHRFPPTMYAISYRSEVKANKGVQDITD